MKRFIAAVVMTISLSVVTLEALAQDYGHRESRRRNEQQQSQGQQQGGRGWDRGRDNQGRNDSRGWDRDNQGRNDSRGWDRDNQGRNDRRDWDRNNRGHNDYRGHNDHRGRDHNYHDNRWNHRGWDRRDWRRSWNHGWSGSRHRSTARYYYPRGYTSRHWSIGVRLPSVFYGSSYYVNYSSYGLAPPPWGCQWIRVDADVMLVDISSGEVLDVLYGFYY